MRYFAFILAALFLSGAAHAAAGNEGTPSSMSDQQSASAASRTGRPLVNSQWDTNDDNRLSKAEFNAGLDEMNLYDNLDANDDNVLTQDEFVEGLHKALDYDGDGFVFIKAGK